MSLDESRRGTVPSYASSKLIAYIGNKRALLPFLLPVFLEIDAESPVESFLDPFAGSGSVSRLARSLGWRVMANDAEEYSKVVNDAWLGVSADELPGLFRREGGIERAFEAVNELHPLRGDRDLDPPAMPYIAAHYAPASTEGADWRRERLFYTRENAVFLDRARSAIDELCPSSSSERALLLGALVYEAATHANTSGVFKAYHKGFGGHGRDALGRILAPMKLEPPLLWGGPPSEVGLSDAGAFSASRPADLCYLDPPYNQHQYGSNYHLLNTIARWDRPPVDDSRGPDGSLLKAAGIPPGWVERRSAFCSRRSAASAFAELLSRVDARTILLSYSTEGLVPPEEIVELLSDRAMVSLRSVDYVKYRGGRQSASRISRNREILFIARRQNRWGKGRIEADAAAASEDSSPAATELEGLKADAALSLLLSGPFDPRRFSSLCAAARNSAVGSGGTASGSSGGTAAGCGSPAFPAGEATLRFLWKGAAVSLPSYRALLLEDRGKEAAAVLDPEGKRALAGLLEGAALPDNAAACAAAAELIEGGAADGRIQELALHWLRKLAYRRYEDEFRTLDGRLRRAAEASDGCLGRLAKGLGEIESLFEERIAESRRGAKS